MLLECQIGYYGKNCRHLCSAYCYVTSRCNKFTGKCDGGCKLGWIGNTCKESKFNIHVLDNSYMYLQYTIYDKTLTWTRCRVLS